MADSSRASRSFLIFLPLVIAGICGGWFLAKHLSTRQQPQPQQFQPPVAAPATITPHQPEKVEGPKPKPVVKVLPGTPSDRLHEFFSYGGMLAFEGSRKKIAAKFGSPIKTKIMKIPNEYAEGQVDKYYTLEYTGLSIEVYHVTESDVDILSNVRISSPNYDLLYGLTIGSTVEEVKRALGPPTRATRATLRYIRENDEGNDVLEFSVRKNLITETTWVYYYE